MIFLLIASTTQIIGNNNSTDTIKAMFLGNSYTAANSLPDLISNIASSTGDTLIFNSNTPGGYTLQQHASNQVSLNMMMQGGWDFISLQEQSQRPSFPISQVVQDVFPYAKFIDSVFNVSNFCGETIFFMTWGRKNGDAINCPNWPPVCTYEGMDSLLHLRYQMMADSNAAILSPVGAVWHYIRDHHAQIELYEVDESHPSPAGSYAGACTFYTVMFRKDPSQISFDFNLPSADAAIIRSAVKTVVFDSLLHWNIGKYDPKADFSYSIQNEVDVTFTSLSEYASQYFWDFGDGNTSAMKDPIHSYSNAGIFQVLHVATHCSRNDSTIIPITITTGIPHNDPVKGFTCFPNPVKDCIIVNSDLFLSNEYQIILSDDLGQTVDFYKSIKSSNQMLHVENIAAGRYFIRIIKKGETIASFPFIKN
ncbi:PKD domain-containing protein [Bacteroidota bacterium]